MVVIEKEEWVLAGHNISDSIPITRYYRLDEKSGKEILLTPHELVEYFKSKINESRDIKGS